jgi:hypothetical protein
LISPVSTLATRKTTRPFLFTASRRGGHARSEGEKRNSSRAR